MRALVLLAAVLVAGCVQAPAEEAIASTSDAPVPAAPAPLATGEGCREGGGHSVHPRMLDPLPKPWVPADVLDDVGPQLAYSEIPDPSRPVPEKGHTIGNYHATVLCDAWTVGGEPRDGLVFGFVGMKVETPPFGSPGPTHEYLVTVVATDDDALYDALHAGGVHAMRATASWEALAGGALRIRMGTDHNGDYDSLFKPKPMGEMKAAWVRLWFQAATDDGYRPVALDLVTTKPGKHAVADQQGYFSHSGTHHHFPLPGAYGHTAALLYEAFDRSIQWGPAPDVVLARAYEH